MRKLVEFLIYIAGVVFFSWNYYRLKGALDIASLLIFAALYLFGVSRLATFAANKLAALLDQKGK
jgi:hypothetical protein